MTKQIDTNISFLRFYLPSHFYVTKFIHLKFQAGISMKINRIYVLLIMLWLWQSTTAQNWLDLREQGANYYQIRDAFNRQYAGKIQAFKKELAKEANGAHRKGDKFERQMEGMLQFMRWSHWVEPRVQESNGDLSILTIGVQQAIVEQKRRNFLQNRTGATWSLVGPLSTPSSGGNGRINAVRALPGSTTTLFACSPAGGLWKTTNGGTTWTAISDDITALGATDVGFDPINSNIMYLVTGDGEAADVYSTGVYKSTDGGATWAATGALWTGTGNFSTTRTTLSKIAINPTDGSILVAGSAGIYRSTNGGTSWTRTVSLSVRDIEFKPGTPSTVYAGGYSANVFLRSTDGGVTWSTAGTGLPTSGTQRVAIAVTPLDANYVYALVSNNTDYGFKGLYLSTDGGSTFTLKSSTPNILGWNATGNDSGGQGWYDLSIVVDPSVKTTIYTGGVNIWKSTSSGASWSCIGHWSGNGAPYEHADVHDLSFVGSTLYAGNDGGVFTLASGATNWSDKSSNLTIAQLYGIGLSANSSNTIIAGHQDNGTTLTTNLSTWAQVNGGDGMLCFIDRTNNNNKFSSIYNGALYRSTSSTTTSFSSIYTVSGGGWVTPWLQDPVTATTLYAGGTNVVRSTNLGTNWTTISSFSGVGTLVELDVAKTNNQYIAAASATKVMKTTNGGTSWTDITTGLPTGVSILTVRFDVNDANKIYVGLASYAGQSVYMSANGGTSWTNISTGLPSLPVNCFASQTNGDVYCGTDLGAYLLTLGASTWTSFTNGMPGVPVKDLEIYYPTNLLRAATYGRGIWSSPLNNVSSTTVDAGIAGIVSPSGTITTASITPSVTLKNFGTTTLTSATIFYKVDNGTESATTWIGSLAPSATASVSLPSVTGYTAAAHTYTARTASPNGTTDNNAANDASTSNFTYTPSASTTDAGISAIATPNGTISTASVTPSVTLKNFGTVTLVSTTIYYKIDNGTESSQTWTGSLASNATTTVTLGSVTGYTAAAHTFTARTAVPNGTTDANTANDALTSNFTYTVPPACSNTNETTNNVSTGATIVAVNSTTNSQIGSNGDVDYYKFTTTTAAPKIQVTLSNLPGDYDVTLYKSKTDGTIGTQIGLSENGGTSSESIKYNTATVGGIYYIRVYGYNGAYSTTVCYALGVQTSSTNFAQEMTLSANGKMIEEATTAVSSLAVFPNPAKDVIKLQFFSATGGRYEMSLFDATGKRVLNQQKKFDKGMNNTEIQTDNLVKGMFLLSLKNEDETLTQKVIVR